MTPVLVSTIIFSVAFILILTEKLDRTIVAMVGAASMVTAGHAMGFYDEHHALEAVDFETLGLLFGMMTLVSLLKPTGAFEYLAIRAAKLSRGRPAMLLILLGSVTSVLSMILDNVTTVVLIAPVTVLIAEILGISAVPFLITEALLSNTGGVATLIGDPPNILIGSAAGLTFNDFLTHSLPVVVIAWAAALGVILWVYRKQLSVPPINIKALEEIRLSETLKNPSVARKLALVIGITVLLFFLQGQLGISSSFIALSMASVAFVWIRPTVGETLERIEWPVLVFFGGLFVMVGGLEAAGALQFLKDLVLQLSGGSMVYTAIAVLWLAAIGSALVDNIPITMALIPVIHDLSTKGIDVYPLWWALAFGAGFGGNGTIIGSTANIIVVQIASKTRNPITTKLWMRSGLPVMLVTCLVGSLAFILFFTLFTK